MPRGMGLGVDPHLDMTKSKSFPERKQGPGLFSKLYSNAVVPARDKVASFFGGAPDNPAHNLHEFYNEQMADKMTPWLGERATRGLLNTLGHVNEIPSYWAQVLSGKPGFSQQGFDMGDIAANERGMERGFMKHRPRRSPLARFGEQS